MPLSEARATSVVRPRSSTVKVGRSRDDGRAGETRFENFKFNVVQGGRGGGRGKYNIIALVPAPAAREVERRGRGEALEEDGTNGNLRPVARANLHGSEPVRRRRGARTLNSIYACTYRQKTYRRRRYTRGIITCILCGGRDGDNLTGQQTVRAEGKRYVTDSIFLFAAHA